MDPVLPAGEPGHRDAEGHRLDEDLDEARGLRAHDVRAEQQAGVAVGDELAAAEPVLHRPSVGHVAELLDLDGDVVSLLARLGLRESHRGDLRPGEDRVRDVVVPVRLQVVRVQQVVVQHALLEVGDVLELVGRRDVAERPDALGGGAPELVHPDPVVVHLDPGRRGVEEVAVARAPGGDQEPVALAGRAVLEGDVDAPAVVTGRGDLAHRHAQPHVPALAGRLGEPLRDRAVGVLEQHVGAADHGDPHAERREDVGELACDEPGPEDHQRLGELGDPHDVLVGEVPHPGVADHVGDVRPRAGGHHDDIAGDGLARPGVDGARADEAGVPVVDGDVLAAVAPEVLAALGDRVDAVVEHAGLHRRPVDAVDVGVDVEAGGLADLLDGVGGVDEHLGRDAPDVEAGAPEAPLLADRDRLVGEVVVDQRVAGAGADQDDVEVPGGAHVWGSCSRSGSGA